MNGLDARAIRRLHGLVSKLPIIAVTPNAMNEEVHRCLNAGMNDRLATPIDRELLRRALAVSGRPTCAPQPHQ